MLYKTIKIEIKEASEDLLQMSAKASDKLVRNRLLSLYLYQSGQAVSYSSICELLGCERHAVAKWFKLYAAGGIEKLTSIKPRGNRKGNYRIIRGEALEELEKRLEDSENSFESYIEVQKFASEKTGKELKYKSVWNLARNLLKSKLKVPRPSNIKKDKALEEKVKQKSKAIAYLVLKHLIKQMILNGLQKVALWAEDEARIGLHTQLGRKITRKGVKPIGKHQMKFESHYLYALLNPLTGESYYFEAEALNGVFFQSLTDGLAEKYPDQMNIILLDNASFHKCKNMKKHKNIHFIYLPPYTPELNPVERFWQEVKRPLKNQCFENIDQLKEFAIKIMTDFMPDAISQLTLYPYLKVIYEILQHPTFRNKLVV